MRLISILTDEKGKILTNNYPNQLFKVIQANVSIAVNQKILLANVLEENYVLFKVQLNINNSIFNQYIFDQWCISSFYLDKECYLPKVKSGFEYKDFNTFEQEVIFALLSGYGKNKDIELYLQKMTAKPIKGNLKHVISMLYLHFNADNRTALIKNLKKHGYDRYLPISLFPPGIYNLENNNKISNDKVVVF